MAKSPKATREVRTYTYPDPLDADNETQTDMIYPEVLDEDPRPWIKVRIPRSRRDIDASADCIAALMMQGDNGDGLTFKQQIAHGNEGLFDLLVEEWSFDLPINIATYRDLDLWAGDWVVACVADASRRGTARDYVKKTASSSPSANGGQTESQPVSDSV